MGRWFEMNAHQRFVGGRVDSTVLKIAGNTVTLAKTVSGIIMVERHVFFSSVGDNRRCGVAAADGGGVRNSCRGGAQYGGDECGKIF